MVIISIIIIVVVIFIIFIIVIIFIVVIIAIIVIIVITPLIIRVRSALIESETTTCIQRVELNQSSPLYQV